MQRLARTKHIVWFTPDEVRDMIIERLRAEGIEAEPIGVQIKVVAPFEGNTTVHNEVPSLTIILAGAGT